jgi:Cu(I)/Ag(I) efflux system membrane fusion protein
MNSRTRTVTVRTTLKNNENLFKPGMFVSGKIKGTAQAAKESLNIPASAVLWTGERSLVYVKPNPNEVIFEMREVTVGLRNGDNFTVASGLENGEEIVTNGTFTVDAAAQLQGKKSMMNKTGGKTMTGHEGHSGMHGDSENKSAAISTMEMKLSKAFQTAFQAALKPYFKMKDAFIASEASQVSALAKTTLEKMKAIEVSGLGKIENSHLSKSIEMLGAISSNSDVKKQRAQLVVLNENLVALAMNIKSPLETLYVQKCPMANSNKGAIWLSMDEEIKNPYYGDAMLTCGSVIDSIK